MRDARRFIDTHGFAWQVCELWSPGDGDASSFLADAAPVHSGWLYFFSRGTTLVQRDYPTGWDELSWQELEALCQRAQVLGSDTAIRLPRRLRADDASRQAALASATAGER